MSKTLVVFRLTVQDMLNHLRPAAPASAPQITLAKGFEQRLRLIEPGGIDRSPQHVDTRRQILEECRGVVTRVARSVVDDQVDAVGPAIGVEQAAYGGAEVFPIVLVQT